MKKHNKIKILLIEDDLALGSTLSLAMESAGYDVKYCSDLTNINSILKEYTPKIILLDVDIAGQNSIELIPQIKTISPSSKIVMISSNIDDKYIEKAILSGAENYLKKPFGIAELTAYLKKYSGDITPDVFIFGNSKLLLNENTLFINNSEQHKLTKIELALLKLLIINANKLVTRDNIIEELYSGATPSEHSINNIISKIRKMISSDSSLAIKTSHKCGYILTNPISNLL